MKKLTPVSPFSFFLLFFYVTLPSIGSASLDCSQTNITGVPVIECESLVTFYDETGGDNWSDNTNWKTATAINDWYGVTVADGHVTRINFFFNNISGYIPAELTNLTHLTSLQLHGGELTGSIPVEIFNLSHLTDLNLNFNQLTGNIPSEIGQLSNLVSFSLHTNQFSGAIPREIGDLEKLEYLGISSNQLSGDIPLELFNITSLETINMTNNRITGIIPSEISQLTNLTTLSIGSNQLTGQLPIELFELVNLSSIYLFNNELSGELPNEISNLQSLNTLNIKQNQFSGNIPSEMSSLSALTSLDIGYNYFKTQINNSVLEDFLLSKDPDWADTQLGGNDSQAIVSLQPIFSLLLNERKGEKMNQDLWDQLISKARVGDVVLLGHDKSCSVSGDCNTNSLITVFENIQFAYGYYSHAALITAVNKDLGTLTLFHAKGPSFSPEQQVAEDVYTLDDIELGYVGGVMDIKRVKNVQDSAAEFVAGAAVMTYDDYTYYSGIPSTTETYCSKLVMDAYGDFGYVLWDQDTGGVGVSLLFFTPDELGASNNLEHVSSWWDNR